MKKIILFLLILTISKNVLAQYKPVDEGSSLKFKIENLGFDVPGSFTGFSGSINFDPQNPGSGSFDVTIDAATVNTDNSLRDSHLKGDSYFDVKNYPHIHFISRKVGQANKDGSYTLIGQLIIKGKTKDVSFPFTVIQLKDGMLFKGSFKINRKDFGIGGTSTISNELEVSLNVLAKKV